MSFITKQDGRDQVLVYTDGAYGSLPTEVLRFTPKADGTVKMLVNGTEFTHADADLTTAITGAFTDLATAAVATTALGTTTVTAISATASSAVATADAATQSGSYVQADVQTIATLATALKVQLNINATENADLRARQAQNKTAIDALTVTVGSLVTHLNAIQAALDAVDLS